MSALSVRSRALAALLVLTTVACSPDGRWAATASGNGAGPRLEDVFLSLSGAEYSAAQGTELARTIKLSLPPGRYQLTVTAP